jgi:hypothetical protein
MSPRQDQGADFSTPSISIANNNNNTNTISVIIIIVNRRMQQNSKRGIYQNFCKIVRTTDIIEPMTEWNEISLTLFSMRKGSVVSQYGMVQVLIVLSINVERHPNDAAWPR